VSVSTCGGLINGGAYIRGGGIIVGGSRYINTSGNWKKEKLCGNGTPEGWSVFTQYRVFPMSTSVDITVYQYGKNVLYLFYNIAQRNIKKEIFRLFRVDIELYQHLRLLANQRSEFTNAIFYINDLILNCLCQFRYCQ
jgi:hypothetical protein